MAPRVRAGPEPGRGGVEPDQVHRLGELRSAGPAGLGDRGRSGPGRHPRQAGAVAIVLSSGPLTAVMSYIGNAKSSKVEGGSQCHQVRTLPHIAWVQPVT